MANDSLAHLLASVPPPTAAAEAPAAAAPAAAETARRAANVDVTPNPRQQDEPSDAVDPRGGPVIVTVANDYRAGDSNVGLYVSTSGVRGPYSDALLPLPPGLSVAGDPVVDSGFGVEAGSPLAVFMVAGLAFNRPSSDGTIIVHRSLDSGATFQAPVVVSMGFGTQVYNDKPYLSIDKSAGSPFLGQAYVSCTRFFHDFTGSAIFVHRSLDHGATWRDAVCLSELGAEVQGSNIAVGPRGEVYVSWIQFGPGAPRFLVRRSDDGGVTFGPQRAVATISLVPSPLPVSGWGFRVPTFSYLGVDNSTGRFAGRVYAVWQDFRHGSADILLATSLDGGVSWGSPRRVNDSPPGAQDFFPSLSVSRNTGKLELVYYTNRASPAPGARLDVFAVEAPAGGLAFPNRRVTDTSFDPNADHSFGTPSVFIGDYIGTAALSPRGMVAVWTDTRTGSQDIFAGV